MTARWAIACDFDATATVADVGDEIAMRFAGQDVYWRAEEEYKAGTIDFGTLLRRLFEPIRASRDEIAAFARERGALRGGFERFVRAARASGRPFVICSAGLDVYIEPVLATLPDDLRAHVAVRANVAEPGPEGLRLTFPHEGKGCGRCGSCKQVTVEDLRAAGYRVAFVGDGTSDRCAARVADVVFARAGLARWCASEGIAHQPYETFHDVVDAFPGGW